MLAHNDRVRDPLARAPRWRQLGVRAGTHSPLAEVHIRLQLSIEVICLVARHTHPDSCKAGRASLPDAPVLKMANGKQTPDAALLSLTCSEAVTSQGYAQVIHHQKLRHISLACLSNGAVSLRTAHQRPPGDIGHLR